MKQSPHMLLLLIAAVVFLSGCEADQKSSSTEQALLRTQQSFELDAAKQAWLQPHLPAETVAYLNLPTPWNYLFDAKADALHAVQSLPAHQQQVERIQQGLKDSYYQYLPTAYQPLVSLAMQHISTSLEVAVINDSATALLPTVAVGTRITDMTADQLIGQLQQVLQQIDPTVFIEASQSAGRWTFRSGQFPAFIQYDEADGRLLVFGGMGASVEQLQRLWQSPGKRAVSPIQALSQQADPSGLNFKLWLAPARLYQLGGAFVPPQDQKMIQQAGLDQLSHLWVGFESSQGQSALAIHALMPETGWRLALPRATDWFDVQVAGQPRSVWQFTLPTSGQIEQAIDAFELDQKLTAKDREEMAQWRQIGEETGIQWQELFDAYHQQIIYVNDDSGSWYAMKIKDMAMHEKLDAALRAYFDMNIETKSLEGVEIMGMHISLYQQLFAKQENKPAEAAQIEQFLGIFKEHIYWYVEDDVFYMSALPQVLSVKKRYPDQIVLSSWLQQNQGGNWNSAVFAYGKDVDDLPQKVYHYYLLLLQALGDLAQTEVDLFALPTAQQLSLPDAGRLNLILSSDQDKVSLKLGYEYTAWEPFISAEGGVAFLMMAGIVTAYAVPAYRDYTVRAKIIKELAVAASIKPVISEHYMATGSFEGLEKSLEMVVADYEIDPETGTIMIDLSTVDDAFSEFDYLYLEPLVDEGYITWSCYSSVDSRYLPATCR